MKLIGRRLLNSASAVDASASADLGRLGVQNTQHYIQWNAGTSVGTVVIETAPRTDYAGEWGLLTTVTFAGTAPKVDPVALNGAYAAIRHRITIPLNDGGSVTSKIEGSD